MQLFCVVQLQVRWNPKRNALLAATRDTTTTTGTGGADAHAAAVTAEADLAVRPTIAALAGQEALESENKPILTLYNNIQIEKNMQDYVH